MRPIKFRAWDDRTNEMFTDFLLHGQQISMHTPAPYLDSDGNLVKYNTYHLMQYTGLKDKNGKEIFEGDILADMRIRKTKGHVVFHEGAFRLLRTVELPTKWLNDTYVRHYAKYHSVIGNIYENPDLIRLEK